MSNAPAFLLQLSALIFVLALIGHTVAGVV